MAFFKFLKKKEHIKKIKYGELRHLIEEKKKYARSEEAGLLKMVREDIEKLDNKLTNGIAVLKDIDLQDEREDERIKLIVMENLGNYIFSIERLKKNLANIEENSLYDLIDRVAFILSDFNKKTSKNYERATILIGKEMVSTRKNIISFSNSFRKEEFRNNELIDRLKNIVEVEDGIERIKEIYEEISYNKRKQIEFKDKSDVLKKEIKKIKDNILEIKKSKKYLAKISINQKRQDEVRDIELEKQRISGLIDYKIFAKKFHKDMNKMELIKRLRKSPKEIFVEDNLKQLIKLSEEAGVNIGSVFKMVDDVLSRERKVMGQSIMTDETEAFNMKIIDGENRIMDIEKNRDRFRESEIRLMKTIGDVKEGMSEPLLKIKIKLII